MRTAPSWLLLVLALASPPALAQTAAPPDATPRPNVVVFLVDDLDETTSPYRAAMPRTQALIAERGLRFVNAFAPDPICCPARATILTGQYAHNTGVLTNAPPVGGFEVFVARGNEERTVAVRLQDAGYRTALVGKYLNGYENDPLHVPPGWSEWYGAADNAFYTGYGYTLNENGTLVTYGRSSADYATDVVARKAVEFVERAEADDAVPFFLYLAPTAPHAPIPPAPRHSDHAWKSAFAPRTPSWNEPDVSDKPFWLAAGRPSLTAAQIARIDRDFRDRMGSLLAVDEMVGAVVATLEARGELDRTLLVFVSDNGYNLGAHRLVQKMAPYEESIRIPLVIAGPGVRRGVERRMVSQADFAPTFLELAGVPVPDDVDGRSLVPLLRGDAGVAWRRDLLLQYHGYFFDTFAQVAGFVLAGVPVQVPTYHALRTPTHLYVEWYGEGAEGDGRHEEELYDLGTDPFQRRNLLATPAGRAQNAAVRDALADRLATVRDCSGATCRD